jgi:hypothetical protein
MIGSRDKSPGLCQGRDMIFGFRNLLLNKHSLFGSDNCFYVNSHLTLMKSIGYNR